MKINLGLKLGIPFDIHVPHSAGLNLANAAARRDNQAKIEEGMRFTNALESQYLIFHSGTNEMKDELKRIVEGICHGAGFCLDFSHGRDLSG